MQNKSMLLWLLGTNFLHQMEIGLLKITSKARTAAMQSGSSGHALSSVHSYSICEENYSETWIKWSQAGQYHRKTSSPAFLKALPRELVLLKALQRNVPVQKIS